MATPSLFVVLTNYNHAKIHRPRIDGAAYASALPDEIIVAVIVRLTANPGLDLFRGEAMLVDGRNNRR